MPHWLIHLGALGVFAVSLIDASIIPLPLPGSTDLLVLLLAAHRGNPWLLAVAAISGSVIGGYLTWSAGKTGGESMLQRYVPQRFLTPITRWVKQRGVLTVSVASILPPPVPLTPFLLSAGALGVPRNPFLISFAVARTMRYSFIAWLGVTYGRRVIRAWSRYLAGWSDAILWTFVGLLVAAVLFGLWRYKHDQRRLVTNAPAREAS
ncbi:MAG TPA: VTT domain-containing protein [Silvibacterium sp.]|jgi:membrane protein YqaA with SNARE-associated domain|nr:VTT domain-containing protein [Silvibacterium sp.]